MEEIELAHALAHARQTFDKCLVESWALQRAERQGIAKLARLALGLMVAAAVLAGAFGIS